MQVPEGDSVWASERVPRHGNTTEDHLKMKNASEAGAAKHWNVAQNQFLKASKHRRSNSFQRWMHRAWNWVPPPRDEAAPSSFNPEVMTNQKRQWYRTKSMGSDRDQRDEPSSLFEQFIIVGLHSKTNKVANEGTYDSGTWLPVMENAVLDLRKLQGQRATLPSLEPQILFKYPRRKKLAMRMKDLPAFCFPKGIQARLLEKTPSMSDLNEVVYGQEHLCRDDLSFIFSLKVADNATLYGVCLHIQEIVQRPPGILGDVPTFPELSERLLVAAPRCYCILTTVPFFDLHYAVLNSIVAQERLERITQFVNEMAAADSLQPMATAQDKKDDNSDSSDRKSSDNQLRPQSPRSGSASKVSDFNSSRDEGKEAGKISQCYTDQSSEALRFHSECEGMNLLDESVQITFVAETDSSSSSCTLELVSSSESFSSSAKSIGPEEDEAEYNSLDENNATDEEVIVWAKENKINLLQIVCTYHALRLPSRGAELVFQPLDHFQSITYSRPTISALGLDEKYSNIVNKNDSSAGVAEPTIFDKVNAKLAAAEEALALSVWTTAAACRTLSLESILALLTGVLLEKQVLVICSNLGILSATVLSMIPMIRPFEWQSLLLPVLPRQMLGFLDAPVPYIIGVQNKPTDLKLKTSDIIRLDVHKDQVKKSSLPQLPRYKELICQLAPIHARLSCGNSIAKRHPIYKCNEVQVEAVGRFLSIIRCYLESLCSSLQYHTITNVQANNDKVSLLLKESFIHSFPSRDQPFMKLFVETQLFSVLSDSRLSRIERH